LYYVDVNNKSNKKIIIMKKFLSIKIFVLFSILAFSQEYSFVKIEGKTICGYYNVIKTTGKGVPISVDSVATYCDVFPEYVLLQVYLADKPDTIVADRQYFIIKNYESGYDSWFLKEYDECLGMNVISRPIRQSKSD